MGEFFVQQKREIYVEFQRVCFSQIKLDRELNSIYLSIYIYIYIYIDI